MAYEPTEWKSGDVVTSAKLNKMEQGIENATLPAVTSDDNGDVLTVVEGAWAKASPQSGNDLFIINFTNDESDNLVCDKTFSQIEDALNNNAKIIAYCFGVMCSSYGYGESEFTFSSIAITYNSFTSSGVLSCMDVTIDNQNSCSMSDQTYDLTLHT